MLRCFRDALLKWTRNLTVKWRRLGHLQTLPQRWLWFVFIALVVLTVGCRRKKIDRVNLEGKIAILKPYTDREKRVRDKLSLSLRLYEPEGVQVFDIVVAGQTIWRQAFTQKGLTEIPVQTVLDLEKFGLKGGTHLLMMRMRDQEGQDSFARLSVVVDDMGPEIAWIEPQPQVRISEVTRAELQVKDESDVQKVEVFFQNRLLQSMAYPPYAFSLDPTEFPGGIVNFRVVAHDGLGNRSTRTFAFEFAGSGEGAPCSMAESCKTSFLCVRKNREIRGICRRRCQLSQDCGTGFRCVKAGKFRACVPVEPQEPTQRTATQAAGLMEMCGVNRLCRQGLICVQLADFSSRCLAICGPEEPPCPGGYLCKKAPQVSKQVCVPLVRRGLLRQIGQSCSEKEPCVKEAVCAREPGKTESKCYKKCGDEIPCSAQHLCRKLAGKSYGICTYAPFQTVGAYQKCSPERRCEYGYECISSASNPAPRCFPSCKEDGCSGDYSCVRSGAYAVCLQKCDPQKPSCPDGTVCGGTQTGRTLEFLCR